MNSNFVYYGIEIEKVKEKNQTPNPPQPANPFFLPCGPLPSPARSVSSSLSLSPGRPSSPPRGPRARGSTARRSSPQTHCPFPHRQHGPTLSGSPSSFRARATNPEIPGPVISPAFLIGCARWDPGAPFKPPRSPSGNPTSPPHQTPNPGRLCSATHNPCAAVD